MDTAVNIALIILMLAAAAMCVYVIITLKQLTKTLEKVQDDVQQIKNKIDPILTNVDILSGKVVLITEEIESLVSAVKILFDGMKSKMEGLFDRTKKMKTGFTNAGGSDWLKKVAGVSRGVTAFWTTLKNK